jgi:hypothetical protein
MAGFAFEPAGKPVQYASENIRAQHLDLDGTCAAGSVQKNWGE